KPGVHQLARGSVLREVAGGLPSDGKQECEALHPDGKGRPRGRERYESRQNVLVDKRNRKPYRHAFRKPRWRPRPLAVVRLGRELLHLRTAPEGGDEGAFGGLDGGSVDVHVPELGRAIADALA